MTDSSKTVFISYRRSVSWGFARAIFMDLREHGYDVFMDVESIDSGQFDTIILNQIAARAHFLIILTPGTVERCTEPGDWLRREIESAMDLGRNIVPLLIGGFEFNEQAKKCLTGKLAGLPRFNALTVPHDYFEAAMDKLRTRFLKEPVYGTIQPTPAKEKAIVQQKIDEVVSQPSPAKEQLTAEEYFKRGYECREKGNYDGAIANYTEAIRLNPQDATTYYNRGFARDDKGDTDGAIADHTEAIRLNPKDADLYFFRGVVRYEKGDYDGAIADYTESIRLNPKDATSYGNRGYARHDKGDYDGAIADYTEALRLDPKDADLYSSRGDARNNKGDTNGAIADYTEALRRNPQDADHYNNRGYAFELKGDYHSALADYEAALRIDPNNKLARSNRDDLLKKMKKKK